MNRKALLGKALLEVLGEFAVFGALLFVCAGTLLWPAGWAFMALFFGFAFAIVLWLAREEPELLAERMSSPIQRGQPHWDKVFVAAVLVLFVVWLIVMPLDAVRFGWSEVPDWLQLMGALGVVLSFYIMFLTFRENAYLALVVKVQEERGQSVVSTGPYRYVRHPMYASTFVVLPGERTAFRFVVGSHVLHRTAGSVGLEDPPRRADARERTGRIRRVRTEGEIPAHSPRLVSIYSERRGR
jgi:protein-S-isoprenylcysteine O-methyltransferase Ste14